MTDITMIVDLGWGSSGKGLIAGYLAETRQPDTVVTQFGPNAGHTYINSLGRRWVHTMLANGIVSPKLQTVLIGPGSVVNVDSLLAELDNSYDLLSQATVIAHPQAAVVTATERAAEAPLVAIGSTMKGTAAAVIKRMTRNPGTNNTLYQQYGSEIVSHAGITVTVDARRYRDAALSSSLMQVEVAQGYGLSLYHGFYPYCTSRDVSPAQAFADCGLPLPSPLDSLRVVGCLRTFPIRVANRFDSNGEMIGWSGPHYDDQIELQWGCLGLKPELTTVTKLPRRVFSFSKQQMTEAMQLVRPDYLFMNFANYCTEAQLGMLKSQLYDAAMAACPDHPARLRFLGFGPTFSDVRDIGITDPCDYNATDRATGWVP
jgi:adenylosuccinate synthase